MKARRIDLSQDQESLASAGAGEMLLLDGPVIAARDAAQDRLAGLISRGEAVPFSLDGMALYYMSPAPGRDGMAACSAGPTTSSRMDVYLEMLLSMGVTATIGKGPRSHAAAGLCAEFGAPYLAAVGGAGAFYAKRIVSSEVLCWPDLGPEAVHLIHLSGFPVFVGIDSRGVSMFPSSRGPDGLG